MTLIRTTRCCAATIPCTSSMAARCSSTRYDDVVSVYRDSRASSDKKREFEPKFGDSPLYEHHTTSLVFNDPPLHTRVRKLIMGALNQRAIARMEHDVSTLVDGLLDSLERLARAGSDRRLRRAHSGRSDRQSARHSTCRARAAARLVARNPVGARADTRRRRAATLAIARSTSSSTICAVLVAERREHPRDPQADVLTRLIQGEIDGERLTESELLHNCIFLLNAGHETTTNLIGNGMHALLTHREELERLIADPALISTRRRGIAALREPAAAQQPRRRRRRSRSAARASRPEPSSRSASAPRTAIPRSFPSPTGSTSRAGRTGISPSAKADHACAGMNVARLEARIALGRLLPRFPAITLAGAPERDRRIRFRGFRHLPVRVHRGGEHRS